MHEQVYAAHGVSAHRIPPDRPLGEVRRGWSVKRQSRPFKGSSERKRKKRVVGQGRSTGEPKCQQPEWLGEPLR